MATPWPTVRLQRIASLEKVGGEELVYQLEDVIKHLEHSKTIRPLVGNEQADFLVDRARQILIDLLCIKPEDA